MRVSKLFFLSNELVSPIKRAELRIPLIFISFAHMRGKMFKHSNSKSSFVTNKTRQWGNKVVYGAIFLLEDDMYYTPILDAYHGCSSSTLRYNHPKDMMHRITTTVTPISFKSKQELSHLLYKEREIQQVETYVGNLNHPKIKPRLLDNGRHRIQDGILLEPYLELIEEVLHE